MALYSNRYGKSRVRLAKVIRQGEWHIYKNMTVHIHLRGDVTAAYTDGDNRQVMPTDTMKNAVYAVAAGHDCHPIESFALALSAHYLTQAPQMHEATIEIEEQQWRRLEIDGQEHPHVFLGTDRELRTTAVTRSRHRVSLSSGLKELTILKTTNSAFTDFWRDEFTILPDAEDRILGTTVAATWTFGEELEGIDFDQCSMAVRQTILAVFAEHDSASVQHTLYEMGERVLANVAQIEEIALSMPNIHNLPFDLSRFGIENNNEVFVPTDEPHGTIEGILQRTEEK